MRIFVRFLLVLFCVGFVCESFASEQRRRRRADQCRVDDVEAYYRVELDKDYDTRRHAEEIAELLYDGPLMREGDDAGVGNLSGLFRKRELEVQEAERMVRSHLYGDSDEFRTRLRETAEEYDDDEREAAFTVLESIYDAFDYRSESPSEEDFDACLIQDRKAYLVVTKVLVDWMERKDLD